MFLLLLLPLLTAAVDFAVDWAVFAAAGDSSRIEFFYAVPYDQLSYTTTASGQPQTRFAVEVTLQALEGSFVQQGTIEKRARLESFAAAQQAQTAFVDGFSVTVPPGRYLFRLAVVDSADPVGHSGVSVETLSVERRAGAIWLSSLQLGTTAVQDSASGVVSVVPNPLLRKGIPRPELLYVYLEAELAGPTERRLGQSAAEGDSFTVRLGISAQRPGRPDTVMRSAAVRRPLRSKLATALGLDVGGLDDGDYTVWAEVSAPGGRARRESRVRFGTQSRVAVADWFGSLPPREARYVREIKYLATPRELAYYNSLSDSGKLAYLAWFWNRRNLTEFARRMETVELRYGRPKLPGVTTDRGRIYVKYGEPDAVEQRIIESETRPREYWQYYGTGYVFVFIDLRGDGNHRLAWTNAPDEPPTGYENYLSPEEQQQFR